MEITKEKFNEAVSEAITKSTEDAFKKFNDPAKALIVPMVGIIVTSNLEEILFKENNIKIYN